MEMNNVGLYILLCVKVFLFVKAQVTFNPDTAENVQLQVTELTPPVDVTTVNCYSSSPEFKVQYVTLIDYRVVLDIPFGNTDNRIGVAVFGGACLQNQSQYRIKLDGLKFNADPVLVGGIFKIKATLDNNEQTSTYSERTYTFQAPFNLTGSSVSAVLNSLFTWTCHVTSDYPIIEWYRDTRSIGQNGIVNGACVTANINESYTYSCQPSALTYTLTIPGPSLTEELQGSTWRCRDATSEVKGSKFMNLDIVVPVTTVTISPGSRSTLSADEYQILTFLCTTNDVNPPPTIHWFIGSTDVTSQAGSNTTTLTLNVTREEHKKQVRCEASNSGNAESLSDSAVLDVRFQPATNETLKIVGYNSGQVLYENNSTIIDISCIQPGGNPVANMTFTCGSGTGPGTNENTYTEAIRRLSLTNSRTLNGLKCECVSTHINGYSRNKSVTFIVYYPPSVPTISLRSAFPWKATGTYNLTCNTTQGNPADTRYIWKEGVSVLPITSQTYEFKPLNSTDNERQLYCQVNNDFTLHKNVTLRSSITTLQVEYDPDVKLGQRSVEVIEGHTSVLRCSATGNPMPTVTWYRDSTPVTESTISSSKYNITNASRTLTGYYTCKATSSSTGSNILQPDQKNTLLRVFYPPKVQIHLQNTTENTRNHTLRCSATGDPNNATIVALQQRMGSTFIRNITSFTESSPGNITLTIPRVSYQDMGTYTCLASNGLPGRSNQTIQSDTAYLNVTTSAKFKMLQYTMRYDIGTIASVSIPFYRNPPATESDIMWVNTTGASNKTLVSSSNVFLSLTYTDVQQILHGVDVTLKGQSAYMVIPTFQDYYEGTYDLKIRSNHTDSAEVHITLKRTGPPDTPSDFLLLTRKVTSIVLAWNKGSDGGRQQTFVVLYREKTAEVYDVKQIVNTRVNVTITDEIKHLKSDTSYEFILYSFNEKGNSTGYKTLEERTLKGPVSSTSDSLNSGLVGGAVGGGAAVVVAVIVIIVLMRRRQERDKETHLYQNQDRSFYTDLQIDRPTTNDEEERTAYTMLQFGEQHTYSNMGNVHETEGGR